uniref:Odorant receptor n=1 Tax=Lobesia botrana TaxID=209534 RepID=A0A345BEW0_9NEOP|nr:odorant receptors OR38.1 [Lobesia botrana]
MLATLRKFGLRHHDLPTMLWNATVLLRALALDVDSRNTKRTPIIMYVTSAIIMGFYFYTYHLSTYWFIFWRGGGDLLFNILLLSLSISSSIGVVKLLYMYFNSLKLKKIVSEYLDCDAALASKSRMSTNVNTTLRSVKKRAIIFWLIIIGNGVVYVLTPLLTPGRHFMEDDQILIGLEPMFDSPNYEIAFTALFCGVFLTVYAPANITGFIIIIVGYNEAQMLALAQELHHLWEDAQAHYGNLGIDSSNNAGCSNDTFPREFNIIKKKKARIINDYVRQRLVTIMEIHATNINLVKQVENIFKSAIAIEFALLSCGLIGELLGGLENTYIEVPFALVQVSMDCLTGQKLIDANKAFEEAVYACKWENFDVSNKKLILVILQNSQKTMQLSAGGLATLSYTSLMSVFRSIYSAYTALRTTMKLG